MAPRCPSAATEVLFLSERLALPGPLATLADRDERAPELGTGRGGSRGFGKVAESHIRTFKVYETQRQLCRSWQVVPARPETLWRPSTAA